jgi:hypothetical protein
VNSSSEDGRVGANVTLASRDWVTEDGCDVELDGQRFMLGLLRVNYEAEL